MSTDERTSRRGGLPAAQEELLVEAMLRHQVGIDPTNVGEVLDLAAAGFVNNAWRNSPVENWHASGGRLRDGDMLRINSHTTNRVRDIVRRWRTDCRIDAQSPTSTLDTLDLDAIDSLIAKIYRWLIDPRRKLPIGLTLADIAGHDLDEYADHAAETLGGMIELAEERSIHFAFWRTAAHGELACRHWWGTPTWPGLIDRFLTALDDPTAPHWGPDQQLFTRLPARPAQIKNTSALRRLLLQHPWKLDTASARYIVAAGIGSMRDPVPPLPTLPTPDSRHSATSTT